MANKQGTNQIVDSYIGDKLIEARYVGQTKYFDPYTTLTGTLPLSFNSRVAGALKNYRIYGDSDGAGEETENIIVGIISSANITQNGVIDPTTADAYECCIAPIENGKSYGLMTSLTENSTVYAFFDTYPTTNGRSYDSQRYVVRGARTVVIAPITGYLVIRGQKDYGKEMVIEGSTAPTTYVPFGYKIPILNTSGVTENLLNNQLESQIKNGLNVIKNIDGTVKVNGTPTADTFLELCTIFLNINEYWLSGCPSGGNSSNGYMLNLTSTEPIQNYYDIGNDVALHPNLARNYTAYIIVRKGCVCDNLLFKPMLSETRPNHYIPHRYTSNYNLFLGDSKLYEDEYLDYGEQKVYKRTENLFDKNAKDTNNGYVRWHVIISTGAVTQDSSWDVTEYINVKPSTVYTASNCVGVTASICFYDTNKEYISGIPYSLPKPGGYGTLTFTTPNNCAYARTCVLTVNQSGAGYEFERNVDVFMITEGSTAPSSYIPYLQPTDPPVPLPPIPTYKGENTLSSTETVGEVSVKGRIRELTYRRVEYLKSTGTQYIQTDIVPTNTTKTVLDVEFGTWKLTTHSDPERGLIGADSLSPENKNTEIYRINLSGTANSSDDRAFSFYAGYGWRAGIDCYLYNPAIPSRNILILQSNMGSWGSASISLTEAKTLREPTLPMPIFGNARLYEATGSIVRSPFKVTNMSLYNCKIYDSENALSHNLVPVEREDGELGLLDTMTNKFYANAGTGTFEKGEYI